MDEQQEVDALGVDTGEDGCLAIAADGVDVTTEHGPGQDEVVGEHEHADDDEHNRDAALFRVARRGQQIGDERNDHGREDDLEDSQVHRFGHQSDLLDALALAQLGEGVADDAQHADDKGQTIERPPEPQDVRQIVTGDATEGIGGDRHGFADNHGGEPSEHQHTGQGSDEARDTHVGHPESLPDANDEADDEGEEDSKHPVHACALHQQGTDAADEGDQRTDRQVDVGGDDDHHHADGEDNHIGVLLD